MIIFTLSIMVMINLISKKKKNQLAKPWKSFIALDMS